jgi:hypothetical protein
MEDLHAADTHVLDYIYIDLLDCFKDDDSIQKAIDVRNVFGDC